MQLISVAAAALNQTPLDWAGNAANIVRAIQQARDDGSQVLCLPELCISGYGCEDAFHSAGVIRTAHDVLLDVAVHSAGMMVAIGVPLMHHGGLYNAACLVCDGKILGFVCKQHLAGDGIHYEPRWFRRWSAGATAMVEIADVAYPVGDLVFDCDGIRIGFEICEDAWVANRPGASLAQRGVDLILNPSASHFAFGKREVRERFVLEGSRAFHCSYVFANLVGNESGRAIYDGHAVIASGGRLLTSGPRFSYRKCMVTSAVVDVDATRMSRARAGVDPDEAAKPIGKIIAADFDWPDNVAAGISDQTLSPGRNEESWETGPHLKEEEFTRAVSLALFDYARKSRSNGFIVSLSGGADSTAVAVLVALMARFASAELSDDELAARLPAIGRASQSISAAVQNYPAWLTELLTCVYQSTRNSSDTTRNAAAAIARTIKAEFLELDVDDIVQSYKQIVAAAIGRELSWKQDDLALQNIQARVRGPSVWLLANLRGALLLTTSNRSEAAVGYATMDGDTCGGLAPIAGIDKAFLRHWLKWMETVGPLGIGPLPQLSVVNQQQPTAELRPADAMQTDEADLMPYDVLDAIERAAIRDKLVPTEVLRVVQPQFPQYDQSQMITWIERFFRLWCRNQWKRERYAPSFHLDDENLDPKTWCRFPILSGGYERELAQLRADP